MFIDTGTIFMKIEISDRKYWKKLNYLDAKLYIELLSIDGKDNWRFITEKERKKYIKSFSGVAWYEEDIKKYGDLIRKNTDFYVIPVRQL
jgi:hypothetical protein